MAFVAAVLCCLIWAVTIPLAGTPDERQHLVYAASLWQGQLTSPERVDEAPGRVATESVVTVPGAYADLAARYRCFWTNNPTREGCVLPLPTDGTPAEATTRAGRYPPTYYLLVGPATRSSDAVVGIGTTRVLTALLAGAPLGLAVALAIRRRRAALLVLAVTPYTLYLGGLVNPSGWEITSAVALWVGALAMLEDGDDHRDLLAVVTVGVGLVGSMLARPIGPGIVVGILAVCLMARGTPDRARALWRRRDVRVLAVLGAGLAVAAGGWLLWRDPTGALTGTPMPGVGAVEAMRQVLSDTPTHLRQMVWNAVGFPPTPVAVAWLAAGGLVVVSAAVVATARERLAMVLLLLGAVALPVVATLQSVEQVGYVWQGRYGQPVTVGLVVLGAWILAERAPRQVLWWVGAASAALTALVHAWGVQGVAAHWTAWPDTADALFEASMPGRWSPPVPAPLLALAMLVATGILGASTVGHRPVGPRPEVS